MNGKKNALKGADEIPLLGQEQIKDIGVGRRRLRIRRFPTWRKIYIATLAVVFVFVMVILFFKSDFYRDNHAFNDDTDKTPGTESTSDTEKSKDSDIPVGVPDVDTLPQDTSAILPNHPTTFDELYSFDDSFVPDGEYAIIPMDLSMSQYGATYINNSTGLMPDVASLLSAKLKRDEFEFLAAEDAPQVLILHTHATEAYSEDGAISYSDSTDELARTADTSKNVVALGKIMSDILNEKGISTIHCTVLHDSVQYKDSYIRSEATIKEYLKKYPSIKLVIDLQRDDLISSGGDMIRPVTLVDSEATAQVMCVVGSNWGGEECPNWQTNLSLALKIRERLNLEYVNLCRPTELRESTYNQELSPFSLLLKIGSCGNSFDEARRAAQIVADTIAKMFAEI